MPADLVFVARSVYGARNAFAHLASALEAAGLLGRSVDMVLVEEDPATVAAELERRGRRVVLLYGLSSPVFLDLLPELARNTARFTVVVGGPHAEGAYWQLLRMGVYAAVVGDGENTVVALAEHFLGERSLDDVPNIALRDDGRFRITRIELVDLDSYMPHSRRYRLYPPIEIMRGCPFRCRFCQVPWLFKARVRYRSPSVVEEAVRDYVAAGKKHIRFVAPIGFAYMSRRPGEPNVEAIEELLTAVRRAGGIPYLGTFPSETRPEYVTPEVLEVVKRLAANRRIALGLQSGDNRVLEVSDRGHTVEQVFEAVELVVRYGFRPVVDILFGLPGEDEEAVEKTVDAMYKLAEMGAQLRLHTFIPLPGTPFAKAKPKPVHPRYREAIRRLLGRGVLEGDWEEQEQIAPRVYCTIAIDPAPTPEPRPLPEQSYCRETWTKLANLIPAYRDIAREMEG
ncbi:TIGR04013 family B12-binding domain/radical SAM domain-containing protein [Hyperthermus butylicus]|uniref:Fe-S oxidoreductase n=1 Tax=Hyperthermus butylicus (strain DSM 5456 / JCM 9403 / PLM1-5) TaxID=415426 RepID=A2BKT4_HYPBU|nr:TIGR04013 family B12-binding domain/radical SAM domain-containing protein [Hyperthermus butylicus]ABM80595.1 putative Fe-S oxidoreductase [Hyperthermus butylicus DSM 5456]